MIIFVIWRQLFVKEIDVLYIQLAMLVFLEVFHDSDKTVTYSISQYTNK